MTVREAAQETIRWRQTFGDRALPVAVEEHTLNGTFAAHGHDFVEVVLVRTGRGAHRSFAGEVELGEGAVLVIRPGAWHQYVGCEALRVVNCCFAAHLLAKELAWCREDPALESLLWTGPFDVRRRGVLVYDGSSTSGLDALLASLAAAASRAAQVGNLVCLLAELADGYQSPAEPGRTIDSTIAACVSMLEGDLARNWSLDDLARQAALDPSHLVRKFRRTTGLPPMAYLARLRAEAAAALLVGSKIPIGKIAEKVGWPDPNYFARRFRAHFSVSATEYRAEGKVLLNHEEHKGH